MVVRARQLGCRRIALLLVLLFAAAGCGEKKKGSPSGSGGAQLLSVDAKGPPGVAFKVADLPFGTIEIPDGNGWSLEQRGPIEVNGPDGTVVMLQAQDGITVEQRDDYLASYNDVQVRDAPKYQRVAQDVGDVAGAPGARVEGKFDNGTAFVTRDYLLFKGGKVVIVGGRTPAPGAAQLAPLVDHMAASLRMK
ncbi:MAG TPA: hypothetical protein VKB80_30230 [Kofleriaceae bacterium]|nr:hypothetical protein [Kofleriaceae bacterium]